jgi:hypothetical protein
MTVDRATGDHFYTLDFKGELAPSSGYEREDFDCYVYSNPLHGTVPVYRWYKSTRTVRDHFYTTDVSGEMALAAHYVRQGIAFHIFESQQPDTIALNRWFHPHIGDHFYTTHPTGEAAPAAGYVREGILGYVYTSQLHGSVPLWRWYHSRKFKFTFSPGISPDRQRTIWERHTWAYYRAGRCTHLTQQQKDKVRHIYERGTIHHGIERTPGVNASAMINGRTVNVNFDVLFPQGDNEIAMSLLHEMMHCAGYDHHFPKTDPRYFETVPLKAERCIAGFASDVASPAIQIARWEMNEDGSETLSSLMPAAQESGSGCRVLDADYPLATTDEQSDEQPASNAGTESGSALVFTTPSVSESNTANLASASGTATSSISADSGSHNSATVATATTGTLDTVDTDPYDHGFDPNAAIGLSAFYEGSRRV